MSLNQVSPGENVPNEVNVIIEIPANSHPVKYEVDKCTGALFVDRFMSTAMNYPCNYGYVPSTLADDGDPVDVLVITPFPVTSGSVIPARPIGVLEMSDESGEDAKLLAVPIDKLSQLYRDITKLEDLPKLTLDTISHFFEHYKDLEPNKWVKIKGWAGVEVAYKEITDSIKRFGAQRDCKDKEKVAS